MSRGHEVVSGRFPRWAVVRPVVGIVLSLVLVTFVVGHATGLIGDASGEGARAFDVADPLPATRPPVPTPAAAVSESQGADEDGDRDRDRHRDRDPASWADDSTRDPELLRRVEELLQAGQAAPPARFRVSTLNVLGASHTTNQGNKPSYASGPTRIGWIAQLLHQLDVDVVGLQEYELVQHHAFKRRTGDSYGVYPGPALGRNAIRNSIAWERATWDVVRTHTVPIPYFRGNRVPMPYVLLEHLESGRRVWFINTHNPVTNRKRGDNERWRDLATSIQIGLVQRLREQTGHPVVLMGDFNEREEAFCTVTQRTPAVAANGGTAGPPCVPPESTGIDWIFGTRNIAFSDFRRLRGGLAARATDHPVIVADAELRDTPGP
ncbi:MAG TPA: endonuclease/exonuclease/phosphatase family protein [Marmoricola sp.]|nr:endonuclease/exonuclease/phosphatase family protein [Marmoricola sp.]